MLKTFDAAGFTVGDDGAVNGTSMVAWQWLAGNTTGSSNSDGSITSTVTANQTAGCSIVKYTGLGGAGGAQTVGHGLGKTPKMIMIKNRDTTDSWVVYHFDVGLNAITLDTAAARITTGASVYWNDTHPSPSVFTVNTNAGVNGRENEGDSLIAYCFAEIPGYSRISAFKGNGNANGSFIGTGFKPSFILAKTITTGQDWSTFDSARSPINVMNASLAANEAAAEYTHSSASMDFLSNGIKMRGTFGPVNESGTSIMYLAFAEHPFAGTTPATAR